MSRLEEMVQAARVLAAQDVRAYKVFEVRGKGVDAQAFVLKRIGDGGAFCALDENALDVGKSKVGEVLGIGVDDLEFIERARLTPPQWN